MRTEKERKIAKKSGGIALTPSQAKKYAETSSKACLCFNFHKNCKNKQVIMGVGGIGVKVICLDCGVLADIEAISAAITPGTACHGIEEVQA